MIGAIAGLAVFGLLVAINPANRNGAWDPSRIVVKGGLFALAGYLISLAF